MIQIINKIISSDCGKIIHRIGSDSYFTKSTALSTDTVDCFEEVDEVPKYTKAEYDELVASLVRSRYSESEEFAIQRKMINAICMPQPLNDEPDSENTSPMDEFVTYNAFVEQCKLQAIVQLSNQNENSI